jgi:hypothetical protein
MNKIGKKFCGIMLSTVLFSSVAKGDMPEYWVKWVNVNGAERFVEDVSGGMVEGTVVRVNEIIASIGEDPKNKPIKITACFVLKTLFTGRNEDIAMDLGVKLEEELQAQDDPLGKSWTIAQNLKAYFEVKKDRCVLPYLCNLLFFARKQAEVMELLIKFVIPAMDKFGYRLSVPYTLRKEMERSPSGK